MPSQVIFCPRKVLLGFASLLLILALPNALPSDFGNLGLIKTPSARFSPDATLAATLSFDEVADIYNITYTKLRHGSLAPFDIPFSILAICRVREMI